jgi:hypothetical protein
MLTIGTSIQPQHNRFSAITQIFFFYLTFLLTFFVCKRCMMIRSDSRPAGHLHPFLVRLGRRPPISR